MNEKADARFLIKLDTRRPGCWRNFVRFANRAVRFEKGEAILEIDFKGIFPSQILRARDAEHLRSAKWHFHVLEQFHKRPSRIKSSIIFTSFRSACQPDMPLMVSRLNRPIS